MAPTLSQARAASSSPCSPPARPTSAVHHQHQAADPLPMAPPICPASSSALDVAPTCNERRWSLSSMPEQKGEQPWLVAGSSMPSPPPLGAPGSSSAASPCSSTTPSPVRGNAQQGSSALLTALQPVGDVDRPGLTSSRHQHIHASTRYGIDSLPAPQALGENLEIAILRCRPSS
ncbi:hypothetical protein U9M48_036979 [Paspalum notatum var. saurae]|uniref:Uncharacterized protein n=1 Tax=Paspalum notatum var. saurae TaxID=547442 RepID=A0AAQ3UK81_PASNO